MLPEEDVGRRPVPSTSFSCRAWFCRLPRPFFRRGKAAVEEGLLPVQQAVIIQHAQQGAPGLQPQDLFFPLLQPPPAGKAKILKKISLASARSATEPCMRD
jgi:hypothetical protein